MRRAVGLEAVLVDNARMEIDSFDAADARTFAIKVAGPAALLVAKIHKLNERIAVPRRLDAKDAHDVYRLLVAVSTDALAASLTDLSRDEISGPVTREAVDQLTALFATGADAPGARLAGQAEELVGDPKQVALAASMLAEDLTTALAERNDTS
jgi:hypothetical protein